MSRTTKANFGRGKSIEFIVRRLIRIVPLYYIFTVLYLIKIIFESEYVDINELLMSLLFIPYLNNNDLFQPIYSLGWTLNYEIYFYLVFCFGMLFPRLVGTSVIFASITLTVLTSLFFASPAPNGDPTDLLSFFGSPITLFFLSGMLISALPVAARLSPSIALSAACAMLVAAVVSGNLAAIIALCFSAVYVVSCERSSDVGGLPEKSMELLGEASYSIYLTHSFVLGPAFALGQAFGFFRSAAVGFVYSGATVAICVAVGVFVFLFVERPLLSLLRSKLTPPRQQTSLHV